MQERQCSEQVKIVFSFFWSSLPKYTKIIGFVCRKDIFFTKNSSSAISVAKVIGSSIHKLSQLNLDVKLYSPLQIKSIITGYGNADKKQVQEMVKLHLGLAQRPRPDHAADALAAALCLATYETSINRIMR